MKRRNSRLARSRRYLQFLMTIVVWAGFGLLLGISLLAFPAAVLPMAAVWLFLHSLLVLLGKPGWFPLLACLAIVLLKGVAWLPGTVFLLVVMGGVAVLRIFGQRKGCAPFGPLSQSALAIVWFAWLIAMIDLQQAIHTSRRPSLESKRPIICLGDSLTAYGYPDKLAMRLAVPVVNMGRDGISTTDGLEMLPAIQELHPLAVVLELGGHDFLLRHGEAACQQNLETLIAGCQSVGAEVVLLEIPRGIVIDRFRGLERRLASRHDLELISDSVLRRFVLFGPYGPPGMWLPPEWHLSDDGLHPNVVGNELLADEVRDALVRIYGSEIVRESQR